MTRIVLRGAAFAGGTTALVLAAPVVEAQSARSPAPAFEIFADSDHVALRPRLSARAVAAFGR